MKTKSIKYLATSHESHSTDARGSESPQEIMLGDPGNWKPKTGDYLINNHREGGADVILLEIADSIKLSDRVCFVTNELNAAVCAAAAWIQVLDRVKADDFPSSAANLSRLQLLLISYQSEAYHIPFVYPSQAEYSDAYLFSSRVDAAYYAESEQVRTKLELSADPNLWTQGCEVAHQSMLFERFTEALLQAALGVAYWPGEAKQDRAGVDSYRQQYKLNMSRFCDRFSAFENVAILDARGYDGAINPRHLINWAQQFAPEACMTLTVQDAKLNLIDTGSGGLKIIRFGDQLLTADAFNPYHVQLAGFVYRLGFVPMTQCPRYTDREIWSEIFFKECEKRRVLRIGSNPQRSWLRKTNYSGHTFHADSYIVTPSEVAAIMQHHDSQQ